MGQYRCTWFWHPKHHILGDLGTRWEELTQRKSGCRDRRQLPVLEGKDQTHSRTSGHCLEKAKRIYKHIMEATGKRRHRKAVVNKEIGSGNWKLPGQC